MQSKESASDLESALEAVSENDPVSENDEERFVSAAEEAQVGFLAEFGMFLQEHKKWWLIPLIGSLLLLGVISLLAASGAAPFIYTVF